MPNVDTPGCDDVPVSPNQPKTPLHSLRAPNDLWQRVKAKAKGRGETVTDVLIRALVAYDEEEES